MIGVVATGVAIALLLALAACDSTEKTKSVSASTDRIRSGILTQAEPLPARVVGLEDARNPYKGAYSGWDSIIYAGIQAAQAGRPNDPASSQTFDVWFDGDGCMLPILERVRRGEEARKAGELERDSLAGFQHATVDASMTLDDYSNFLFDAHKVMAEYYPAVPAWLAASPPQFSVLLPNGDVMAFGSLGSGEPERSKPLAVQSPGAETPVERPPTYLYDSKGKEKARTLGAPWFLYYELSAKPAPAGSMESLTNFCAVFKDKDGAVLSAWSYDGTQLTNPLDAYSPRDMHNFTRLTPRFVQRLYEAQSNSKGEAFVLNRNSVLRSEEGCCN